MKRWMIAALVVLTLVMGGLWLALQKSSSLQPLHVLLIPADGGTESGTLADYQPIFNAVSRSTGLTFDLKVAQSYGAVVEGMCNGAADIAFVGPVTYLQAKDRGCAQLLAVAVKSGESVYYAGLFTRKDSAISHIKDLRGKRVAFGDVNSTSSFVFPLTMLMDAQIDPAKDLKEVRLTGSHASSLAALLQGRVDAAALSFESYEKAVRENVPGVRDVRIIARSDPIPYPPLVINSRIPPALRERLMLAFQNVADQPGIAPEMIRGYGGGQVDGYDSHFSAAKFMPAAQKMAMVSDTLKSEILRKSAQQ
ncbi:phosphate/phosphite/phosphonate ABC transporter substrate-binding protein [Sphingobium sp. SCG-1]|uniref:phosphate/phosphite/phosphonate ABC transporter substrate-binding protein n=1 Tax=Sphingobium sp. SCG-1 TaxID=2072936 RepID=UPI000CD69CA2|nr:phosphate/phosphite/phosphonate ABC transporter substrate-binding protein [Sphingobium sp. SCG-1]AUW59257.1 phosphate/phosphite/phosphonate ABC transporter substrate-binding protein [Sphingobium sp. SCG-1]